MQFYTMQFKNNSVPTINCNASYIKLREHNNFSRKMVAEVQGWKLKLVSDLFNGI